jgi:multiple sugar transport system permease protein
MVTYAVFSLFPILWILTLSFKTSSAAIAYPPHFIFRPTVVAYEQLLHVIEPTGYFAAESGNFINYFTNTLIISGASTALSLCVGVPAAYALARLKASDRAKNGLLFTFLSFRFLPEMAMIVPLFILFQKIHMADTYIGLIWVYQLIGVPIVVLILRGYFTEVPLDLEHAAMVDGASTLQRFLRIVLPLAVPAVAAAGVLTFLFCWNNFIFGLMLGGPDTSPVTVIALNYIAQQNPAFTQMAAATVIAMAPSLLLAVVALRFLVRGLTLGAVRG